MRYVVTGVDGLGAVTMLELDARDPDEAVQQAAVRGCTALKISGERVAIRWGLPSRSRFSLLLFTQELIALLESGIALVEALETLAEKEAHRETRELLVRVLASLREGLPLSAAFERFPGYFPVLYVATVRASERTGDLPQGLARFALYQAQFEGLRKKLVTAAIYPALLIAVGILVTLFLLGYVVPRFSQVYEDLGDNLPWLSQVLMAWGKLLQQHGVAVLAAAAAALALGMRAARRREVMAWISRQFWRIPAVGERLRIYQLARFYRTVGMLLHGGIAAVPALNMVSGLLATTLHGQLERAVEAVRGGRSLSQAMEMHGLTTPVALRMLRVGERTGRMGEMMERIAAFYDEDMARWIEWFSRLFEPLLMAVIGLVIGAIVLLMYLPIFELAGSIQ
jgi:general secretion pathway protein F